MYTKKRSCCDANFILYIYNNKISGFNFTNKLHNHPLEKIFLGSKVLLLTSKEKADIKKDYQQGLPVWLIRKSKNLDILPQQMYNLIRNERKEIFDDEIQNLRAYLNSISSEYDIIWKNNNSLLFHSVIIVNSRIKSLPYANDLVMAVDTVCTNRFDYPILAFFVFDENNNSQMLAVSIITSKTEDNFIDIFLSLKAIVGFIRVFIVDRLLSQANAIKKVFPESNIVFCRIHIDRNFKNKMGKKSEVRILFWKFIRQEIMRNEYINELQKILSKTPNSKHLKKLIDEVDFYDPLIIKNLRIRGHYSTNALEGIFGYKKYWTNRSI